MIGESVRLLFDEALVDVVAECTVLFASHIVAVHWSCFLCSVAFVSYHTFQVWGNMRPVLNRDGFHRERTSWSVIVLFADPREIPCVVAMTSEIHMIGIGTRWDA